MSNVFACYCYCWSSASPLISNRLSPFWKHVVLTKHSSTMYSRHSINFLNHFKCFCSIKTGFPTKRNRYKLFNYRFFHYNLWCGQVNITSQICISHERFELKLDTRGEEGSLTNFPKFHGDHATSTMFSLCCCKTYQTDQCACGSLVPLSILPSSSVGFNLMTNFSGTRLWNSIN